MEHDVNIKENTHNSIYIEIYNKQIQDVHIIPYFSDEMLFFRNNLNVFQNNCQGNFLYIFKFK